MSATATLFAARDRFGIKPLYYAFHEGRLYIASEVKALAALGVPLRWDREALYDVHFVVASAGRSAVRRDLSAAARLLPR